MRHGLQGWRRTGIKGKMKEGNKKLFPWVCSGIISAMLIIAAVLVVRGKGSGKTGHDIVIFGDSIVAYTQDDSSLANLLSRATGMDVFDLSFGGTLMSYQATDETPASFRNNLCMAAISKGIVADDYSLQINTHISDSATDYFEDRAQGFKTVDFKKTDIVIIEQCINDYHCAVPIGDVNSTSEFTYCGALKMTVENIRRANPDIRIIILSPTMKWIDEETTAEDVDCGEGTFTDYVNAQRKMAEYLGVEYIDLTHIYDAPSEKYEENGEAICGYTYTVDGTHPNYYGRDRIAETIAEYLRDNER